VLILLLACTAPSTDTGDADTGDVPVGDQLIADTVPTVLSSVTCDACGGSCVLENLSYAQRYHTTEPIAYADVPPAGGPHNPCWTEWGPHTEPVADDNWVHNLEHGGVVWLRACDDCTDDATAIDNDASALGDYAVTTPYADMDTTYAIVAWGWRMRTSCYDSDAFQAFYFAHFDQGPESTMANPSDACM
jgi:hypothetical protein